MTREKKPTKGRIAYEFVSPNGIPDGEELHVQETGALVLYFAGGHLWSVIGSEQAEEIALEVLKARRSVQRLRPHASRSGNRNSGVIMGSHINQDGEFQKHQDAEEDLTSARETIRALTEERDRLEARAAVYANRIRDLERPREAPGEEWRRAQKASAFGAVSWVETTDELGITSRSDVHDACITPYEPPRSDEGKPSLSAPGHCPGISTLLQSCTRGAGHDGPCSTVSPAATTDSRLAPLTDRETNLRTAMVGLANTLDELYPQQCAGEDPPRSHALFAAGRMQLQREAYLDCAREIRSVLAGIALPKTPDARIEETIGSGADRWTTTDPRVIALHRELRLATEHAEAMRPVVEAARIARRARGTWVGTFYVQYGQLRHYPEHGGISNVFASPEDLAAWQASDAYESWLNARGGK